MSDAHAATQREEQTFRVFEGEPHYIDGYTPSSLDSQHSSLQRSSTWLGMGFILTSLAGLGAFVFGLSSSIAEPRKMEAPTLSSAQCWPFPAWSLDSVSSTTGAVTTAPTWLPPAASTKKRCPYIVGARTVRLRDKRGYWHLQEQPPSCSFGNVAAVVGFWMGLAGGSVDKRCGRAGVLRANIWWESSPVSAVA